MSRLGIDAKIYYSTTKLSSNSAAHIAGKTWVEITNVKDVTLNVEAASADATTRASAAQGFREKLAGLKDGSVDFEMNWKLGDAAFAAIKDAWLNKDTIAIAVMSGDIADSGEEGLVSNFTVSNFSRNEPLDDVMTVSVTIEPSEYTKRI